MKFTYGTETTYDTLGQPYVTLMCDGVKGEGEDGPLGHATTKEAWKAYLAALNDFISKERATAIEWRIPPTMEERDLSESAAKKWGKPRPGAQKYAVYSRLSVIERLAS